MAELSDRPFPPGSYPVIVVGSGPGGLQVSYCLDAVRRPARRAVGRRRARAACSGAGRSSSGCCRGRSRTRPVAALRSGLRALRLEQPPRRTSPSTGRSCPTSWTGRPTSRRVRRWSRTSRRSPSGPAIRIRYGCRWTGTRRETAADGDDVFVLETTDGEYRTDVLVFAVGVAEPYLPGTPGIELAAHYADDPAGRGLRRQAGLHHRQAELGLRAGVGAAAVGPPDRPRVAIAGQAVGQHAVARRGPGALRPADRGPRARRRRRRSSTRRSRRIERLDGRGARGPRPTDRRRRRARASRSTRSSRRPASSRRSSTCRSSASRRSARAGCRRRRRTGRARRCPASSSPGRSPRARPGLKKHGLPSNSGAVHGARYNARVLARHIAATRFGVPARDSSGRRSRPARWSTAARRRTCRRRPSSGTSGRTSRGSSRWTQPTGPRDEGSVPLAAFVDAAGDDAPAMRSR